MNKIVLNDGTEIEDGTISEGFNKQILIIIPSTDFARYAVLFSRREITWKMISYSSIYKRTFRGYDKITSMGIDSSTQKIHIYMTGTDTSIETEYTVPEEYLPEEMRTKKGKSEDE